MMRIIIAALLLGGIAALSQAQNITVSPLPPQASANIVLNPSMEFDQPLEGTTISAIGTSIDAWRIAGANVAAATFTAGRSTTTPPAGFNYSLLFTTGTGAAPNAGDDILFQQRFEGTQVGGLSYGTSGAVTTVLSYWLRASQTGAYAASIRNISSLRSYVTTCSVTANTWTQCVSVIPGEPTGTWISTGTANAANINFVISCGSNFQTTANAWQAGNFMCTSTTINTAATNSATMEITGVQWQISPVLMPFVRRDAATELAVLQRYYEKTFAPGTVPVQNVGSVIGALCTKNPIALGDPSREWQFKVTKNKVPIMVTYNPSAANANWRDITAAADATVSVDPASSLSVNEVFIATSGTITTLGDILCIHAVADSRL